MRKKEKNERENMSKGWGDRSVLEGGGVEEGILSDSVAAGQTTLKPVSLGLVWVLVLIRRALF